MKTPRERTELVERLYLRGVPDRQIQVRVAAKFGITKRQVRTYLKRLRDKLVELAGDAPPEAAKVKYQAMLYRAYRVAERGGEKGPQPQAMVAAATRMAELDGLLTKRVEHSGAIATTDPQALHDRIAAIVAEATGDADAAAAGAAEPRDARGARARR